MRHISVQSSLCYYIYISPSEAVLTFLQQLNPRSQRFLQRHSWRRRFYTVALTITVQKLPSAVIPPNTSNKDYRGTGVSSQTHQTGFTYLMLMTASTCLRRHEYVL